MRACRRLKVELDRGAIELEGIGDRGSGIVADMRGEE